MYREKKEVEQLKDIDCKTQFELYNVEDKVVKLYEKFQVRVSEIGINATDIKESDCGIQMKLHLPSEKQENARIYNSNKKGLTLELELPKDSSEYKELMKIFELSYRDYLRDIPVRIPSTTDTQKQTLIKNKTNKKKSNTVVLAQNKETQESKEQKSLLDKVANRIIKCAKNNNISVMRYDSDVSESIYLNFDYGMAGSLRISTHDNKDTEFKYTFNIIKGLEKPYIKAAPSSSDQDCDMYFYPFELSKNVAIDIVRYKKYKLSKYSESIYNNYMEKYKSSVVLSSGFWSNAIEV